VEVLNNLFLTTGVQFKKLISSKQPDGFPIYTSRVSIRF
jgi:hypothetical protein